MLLSPEKLLCSMQSNLGHHNRPLFKENVLHPQRVLPLHLMEWTKKSVILKANSPSIIKSHPEDKFLLPFIVSKSPEADRGH